MFTYRLYLEDDTDAGTASCADNVNPDESIWLGPGREQELPLGEGAGGSLTVFSPLGCWRTRVRVVRVSAGRGGRVWLVLLFSGGVRSSRLECADGRAGGGGGLCVWGAGVCVWASGWVGVGAVEQCEDGAREAGLARAATAERQAAIPAGVGGGAGRGREIGRAHV